MTRLTIFFILIPFGVFAQFSITGRVLNQADTKPVANASVFLSNATIGSKTFPDGTFLLQNVKPGKYSLVVSIIGFDPYSQVIVVGNNDIKLGDITIYQKTIALNEVKIKFHNDPDREKYLGWFKEEFLGNSDMAKECEILNPNALFLNYDSEKDVLTASSSGFLEIENEALGYKIKYLLTDFSLADKDKSTKKIYFKGAVLFENLEGSPQKLRRWEKNRQEIYENSSMHFLRAALSDRLSEEGFKVLRFDVHENPLRPSDSAINVKIKFYKRLAKVNADQRDSLEYWIKKSKLPKTFQKLMPFPLNKNDIISPTDQPGQYAFSCDNDEIYIAYNKNHRYHITEQTDYLYNRGNTENTLIKFNSPNAIFYSNGVISNPYSLIFYGVWGRNRVAELLPIDYEPSKSGEELSNSAAIEKINDKLTAFTSGNIIEKAYLHFDKPYYAAGDTIYFKAYLTLGEQHELSEKSSTLYVDMVNANNKIDQSLKLFLADGVTWGDFVLPDSLPKGDYRIRAYTKLMRSEGNQSFFDTKIAIGSILNMTITEDGDYIKTPALAGNDVQFFPEGGELIAGVKSKIAFKATGPNGLGVAIKGIISNNEDKEVGTFTSTHLGMGYFYITAEEGQTYKAKIIYADGKQDIISLPKASGSGILLSVDNGLADNTIITISASKSYFKANRNKEYDLLIWSGGLPTNIPCKLDSEIRRLDFSKKSLQTGTATATLFSSAGEPISERLFFVRNDDQLNVNVNSNKSSYAKREKVNIKLNVKSPTGGGAAGHFSVAVIDESEVPVEENNESTILTSLLLTSDLKGYVEQPNYYFVNSRNIKVQSDLDLVMLTNGYRRFNWKQLLSTDYKPVTFEPDSGLEITGLAKNGLGRPLINGTVSLISPKGGPILSTKTNDNGGFKFSNLIFTDSVKFILQAVNANGKNSTTLIYNSPQKNKPIFEAGSQDIVVERPTTVYLQNVKKRYDEAVKYGLVNGIVLKEVKIRQNKKKIINETYRSSALGGPGHADQVIHRSEFRGGGLFSDMFNGTLRGVTFIGGQAFLTLSVANSSKSHPPLPMQIIIDGVPLPGNSTVNAINVNFIETIEVFKSATASIYGISGGDGVLVITTRQGGQNPKEISSTGILPITVQGFYKAREFYSPKYEHPVDTINRPDLRSTIYWKPEIITDKDGNASIEYYNADGKGSYRVVVEGIDEKGNLGRQVFRYKVE